MMPKPTSQQSPEALYRKRLTIWGAMLFSIVMYGVVMRVARPAAPSDNPILVEALLLAAAVLVAASFGVKSYCFKRARETGKPAWTRAGEVSALVLCDSAALLGVVVWFLTALPGSYWFLILGAAGQILHYPRREE